MAITQTDEAVMLAVRDGDVGKLGILFDRHHGAVFDFFARMTGSPTASDDLVQEVFFRILRYRKTYKNTGRFTSWMFHIARNVRMDHFRRHFSEPLVPDNGIEAQSHFPSPGQELDQRQQATLIKNALSELSPEKREVLVLSRYQEMKYEQIADLLGCEVATVKVRVHRAIKDLREIYLKLSGETSSCNAKN